MLLNKIITGICYSTLLLIVVCQENGTTPESDPNTNTNTNIATTEKANGIFRLLIDQNAQSVGFSGALYNGANPETPWESVMKSGKLTLLVPILPFCSENCGSNSLCVGDDSCSPYPSMISAGPVTMAGVNLSNGTTSFTSTPISALKRIYYPAAVNFADPPFGANSTITLSASGSSDVSAFELTTSGVEPIVLLNDSIKIIDGEPINLSWTPPSIQGTTIMEIEMDISYHGGTKAKIFGDCDDNGSVVIPAEMLAKLKSYGISGFPKMIMTRRSSSAVSTSAKVQLIVEATQQIEIYIPGIISCEPGNDEECPGDQTCNDDRRCR